LKLSVGFIHIFVKGDGAVQHYALPGACPGGQPRAAVPTKDVQKVASHHKLFSRFISGRKSRNRSVIRRGEAQKWPLCKGEEQMETGRSQVGE
jgi:hypothetical protein